MNVTGWGGRSKIFFTILQWWRKSGKKHHQFGIRGILPGKLTCPLKINGWKKYFLLKQSHFRGHVGFQGCKENYIFGFRDPYLKPAPLAHTQPALSHVFSSNSFCCRLKSSHWTRLCRKVGTSMFGPSPFGLNDHIVLLVGPLQFHPILVRHKRSWKRSTSIHAPWCWEPLDHLCCWLTQGSGNVSDGMLQCSWRTHALCYHLALACQSRVGVSGSWCPRCCIHQRR